ncbi:MAG: hypothetical protein JWN25_1081 [Verrucomicrobiales bacterium]|nr:hypothetical protein [Verrucomicrobiales bacterium]
MVQVKIFSVENFAAVLAGVLVALENIVPREFDLLFGKSIKDDQQDDAGDAYLERNCMDAVGVRFLLGKTAPFWKAVGLECTAILAQYHLGVTFEQERECPTDGADIYSLPQSVQHQYVLVEKR